MPRSLPPLTALRAFEAAGRHLSFTRAADELSVTQAAVSHQIKSLESHLGVTLFNRLPRRLTLTETGAALLDTVSRSFDQISVAALKASDGSLAGKSSVLTVRSPPTFGARWLGPKLKSFRRKYPAIDLQIRHSNEPVDFARDDIDLAVTYGDGSWPGVIAEQILKVEFSPVCAPDYEKPERPLDDPSNLRYYNLLHDATTENWSRWLALAGADSVDPARGTVLDDTNVLIQAAIDGQGIALGSSVFIAEHLDTGRLIRPFAIAFEPDLAYHVVCPPAFLERPAVAAFRNWALASAGAG